MTSGSGVRATTLRDSRDSADTRVRPEAGLTNDRSDDDLTVIAHPIAGR